MSIIPQSYDLQLPVLDGWLSQCGTLLELRYEAAARALKNASTAEEISAAQLRLDEAKSLLQWRYDQPLPPIGDLFLHSDGRAHVVLSPKLAHIRKEWFLGGGYDAGAEPLMGTFQVLLELENGNPFYANSPGEALRLKLSPLGKRLAELQTTESSHRLPLVKQLKSDLSKAVERIARLRPAGARTNAEYVFVLSPEGKEFRLPLEVAAIDTARDLAQKHRKCPFKKDIAETIEQRFGQTFGRQTWAKVWRHIGFSKLSRKSSW
jgi:hypothetical protein